MGLTSDLTSFHRSLAGQRFTSRDDKPYCAVSSISLHSIPYHPAIIASISKMRVWNSHFFALAETFAEEPLFDGDPGLFRRAVLKAVHGVQQTHHWSVNPGKVRFFTFCTMLHVAFSHAAAAARWCMRSFRNRRHAVHLVRGPPLAQRLLHLLLLQVQHGQDHRVSISLDLS